MKKTLLCAILCFMTIFTYGLNEEFTVVGNKSLLSVVVQKAGVASYLAHDHLIYAYKFDATLNYSHKNENDTTFSIKIKADNLYADYHPLSKMWNPTLNKLGAFSRKFTKLSDSDRKKVRTNMLSSSQLDSKNHTYIKAKVLQIIDKETQVGERKFNKLIKLSLTVKGKTITREIPGNMKLKNGTLFVEALGKYKFTEFGITPYSALLGAIRNSDDFHLYVNMRAKGKSKK
ncbi:hypothetical protein [Candidatus Uabimicrobium amorphum]|uniref:Lipid/polyisoprenoid-binding YceI-like domain-containing protein n=1 Tax=Uabimicrobium amorphum TaxID=2596890 RepID=A0A5S9IIH0_UABAM|nr:hypothetical protein [Candidatus Uabimicrobium amorphum]BBM82439.1 hypothetical protein UABAM_00782 [Candidatus Uabimicrobium amorphum]